MRFHALESSSDGRITFGGAYLGQLIYCPSVAGSTHEAGLFIVIYNNRKEWQLCKTTMFKPIKMQAEESGVRDY